ncbi:MAG TPA: DUF3667 domain-containing protein [Allosphingosinicella sp.]|nr:DUF3667 domain-containing protein [Allosphingosinicella sp.]
MDSGEVQRPSEEAAGGAACQNCGAGLAGGWCHACGAPDLEARDLSLRRAAADMFEEITNLQRSKLLRTIGALLFKPGFLTAEYFTARRVRYLKPFTLTLSVLALYLFAFSVTPDTSLYDIRRMAAVEEQQGDHIRNMGPISIRLQLRAQKQGRSVAALEEEINDKWVRNASLLQIPLIVVYALLLLLVHLRGRRYFAEHLVFSMHVISFTTLTVVMMWPIYFAVGISLGAAGIAITVAKFILDTAYVVLATRTFYRCGTGKAVLLGLIAYIGYYVVFILLYQLALFLALLSAYKA